MAAENNTAVIQQKLNTLATTVLPIFQQYLKPAYSLGYELVSGGIKIWIHEPSRTREAYSHMVYGPACEFSTNNDCTDTSLHAYLRSVHSTIGYMTGAYLVGIQLHIAYHMGAKEITLENFTDDLPRAARGIYQLFTPNLRRVSENERANLTNLEAALQQSEGAMFLTVDENFEEHLHRYFEWIYEKTRAFTGNHPWLTKYAKYAKYAEQMMRAEQMGGAPKRKASPTSNNNATQPLNETPLLPPPTWNRHAALNAARNVTPPPMERLSSIPTPIKNNQNDSIPPSPILPSSSAFPGLQLTHRTLNNLMSPSHNFYSTPVGRHIGFSGTTPKRPNTPSPVPRPVAQRLAPQFSEPAVSWNTLSNVFENNELPSFQPSPGYIAREREKRAKMAHPAAAAAAEEEEAARIRALLYSPQQGARHKKSAKKVDMRHRPRRSTYRAKRSKHSKRTARKHKRHTLRNTRKRGGACGSCMMGPQSF